MPKLKTKSAAKKRFSLTATGKVKTSQACKRHNLSTKSGRQLRNQRGTRILNESDTPMVKRFFPYGCA